MSDDGGRADELAAAVADRTPVDWESESMAARHPDERAVIQSLKLISHVAQAHHALGPLECDSGGSTQDPVLSAHSTAGEETTVRARPPATPEPLGSRWGSLEILELVGRGSYGDVFRAWDRALDREVALKLLSPETSGHGRRAPDVAREGKLLARVRHPNVVIVYGAAESEGRTGIWMEFIQGRTLEAIVQEHGKLGAGEAALIGTDLCRALAAVHAAGLVHGDIKTRNVMRAEGGRTVLMDFGTGAEVPQETDPANRGVTGTPLYVAPEIYRGEEATPRSDLFSLGVLLYRLVAGGYPFEARTLDELREAHRLRKRRLLRDARADLPDAFVNVVERALAFDPGDRFGSAGEMELALSTALGRQEPYVVPGPDPIDPTPVPVPIHRTITLARVLAAASLAAAAMALFLVPRWLGDRDEAPAAIPLAVEATLFQKGDVADRPLSSGDKVRTNDQLFLEIRTEEPAHVYVLEQDEEGRAYVLFPLAGSDLKNPIAPGARQRLPGKMEGAALSWVVTSAGGREAFLVVASRRRLAELEDLLSGIETAMFGRPVEATSALMAAVRRGIGGLQKAPAPQDTGLTFGGLREILTQLAAGRTADEAPWIREIVLQNPDE